LLCMWFTKGFTQMQIVDNTISLNELRRMSDVAFGNMVKAVVDVSRGLLAVDAEMHADLEHMLLEGGSKQADLWGINLYPESSGEEFVEFDSMINVRPAQGNMSRSVEDEHIRQQILAIVRERVHQ
jgi:hypothetical protein